MDIRFDVGDKTYHLGSTKYDFVLSEIVEVQEGENKGNERLAFIGYFDNVFRALKYLPQHDLKQSECKCMGEVEKRLTRTLDALNDMMNLYSLR